MTATPAALRELADRLDAWGRECEDLDDPHSNVAGVFLSDLISGDFYDVMKEAATQLRTAASEGGERNIVAWTEKDGDEWVVYDADSDTGQYIRDYLKRRHFKDVFPIYDDSFVREIDLGRTTAVARDAERYRWLREHDWMATGILRHGYDYTEHPTEAMLDSAIDAAISGAAGERKPVPGYGGVPIAFDDPELQQW